MTNFDTTDSHLFIGAETINNGVGFRSRFTGLIDEIAIFDVALTKNDLNTIMKNGLEVATGFRSVSTTGKLTTIWGQIKKWNGFIHLAPILISFELLDELRHSITDCRIGVK